jgi:suppressor of fused-like protein
MRGVEDEGSGLSGVSAVCSWEDGCGLKAAGSIITELPGMEGPPAVRGVAHCKGSEGGDMTIELLRTQTLKDVHLVFNLEAAKLIILALKGRLKHGRHFTFKSFSGDVAITFVSSGIEGAFADKEHPLASQGPWLHVYFNNSDIDTILNDIMILNKTSICLPHTFKWPHIHLSITILSSSIT